MNLKMSSGKGCIRTSLAAMKVFCVGILLFFPAYVAVAQSDSHVPVGIVSDWSNRHVLYPDSKDGWVIAQMRSEPRWAQNWYLRHPETWWPKHDRRHDFMVGDAQRDWSVSLGTTTFEPLFDFNFTISPQVGFGSLNTTDEGAGQFLATAGAIVVTAGSDIGSYPLYPGGPGVTLSPAGGFDFDDLFFQSQNPTMDVDGLLFRSSTLEINIWGNSANNYSYYDYSGGAYGAQLTETGSVNFVGDPGGGQTSPAKFVFDITLAPSCTADYIAIGVPSVPASGGQANIVGYNNLYSTQATSTPAPLCGTTGPKVMFAYASGTGEVPAAVSISLKGTGLAYIEDLTTGSSYFHILTIGTTGSNGTGPTGAVVPGTGNNAVDQRVLLSPDGGTTNQSSTTAPWIAYTTNDVADWAYATTYSTAGSGSGYLYKLKNIFSGSAPAIVWSVAINAIPSAPVYDVGSNRVFFTDSEGRIDYVQDTGTSPTVVYSSVFATGATSENAVMLDATRHLLYATFNTNGTNAIVVQTTTSIASPVTVTIGSSSTTYPGPYEPDFNNAWYTGSGTPLMYIAGSGTGALPTLYSFGFTGTALNPSSVTSAALATGAADSTPVTEFFNSSLSKDYLFAGVTNHCVATTNGGTVGCVMRLDITSGFPAISSSTTAIAAAGGASGFVIDNGSSSTQASSVYYTTKTGGTLVKATQSALN